MKLHHAPLLSALLVCVLLFPQAMSYYSGYSMTSSSSGTWPYGTWPSGSWPSGSWPGSFPLAPPATQEAYQAFGAGVEQFRVELSVTPSVVAVEVPPSLLEAVQHEPTTHFVTSPTFGSFFVAFGMTVPDGEAKLIVGYPDTCSCKAKCWSSPWCVAASRVVESNGSVACYFADHLPATKTSEPSTAYYLFYERMMDKIDVYIIKESNEIYAVSQATLLFTQATGFCNSLPGFRLAIFITKPEVDVLLKLLEVLGVDVNAGILRGPDYADDHWADGTLFRDSYLYYRNNKTTAYRTSGTLKSEPYYRIRASDSKVGDVADEKFRTVCQGYLFR